MTITIIITIIFDTWVVFYLVMSPLRWLSYNVWWCSYARGMNTETPSHWSPGSSHRCFCRCLHNVNKFFGSNYLLYCHGPLIVLLMEGGQLNWFNTTSTSGIHLGTMPNKSILCPRCWIESRCSSIKPIQCSAEGQNTNAFFCFNLCC